MLRPLGDSSVVLPELPTIERQALPLPSIVRRAIAAGGLPVGPLALVPTVYHARPGPDPSPMVGAGLVASIRW